MYKELVISIMVIALIVIGNIVTQDNTVKSVNQISNQLNILREEVSKEFVNQEDVKKKMKEIQKIWEEK